MKSWFFAAMVFSACAFNYVIGQEPPADQELPADPPVDGGLKNMFNCKRTGMNCNGPTNATTCNEDGDCNCEAGFQGLDCSLNSTADILLDAECACQNGGLCVKGADGSPSCYCGDPDAQFYGPACENLRVESNCMVSEVDIKITPYMGFVGEIYVKGQAQDDLCYFIPEAEGDSGTWQLHLTFDQCGGAENSTAAAGDVEQTFTVVVQYDDLTVQATDQQFLIHCIIKQTDSTVDKNNGAEVATDEENSPIEQQEVTEEVLPVEVDLVLAEGLAEITGPVRIGTELALRFTLNGGDVYDSFRLEYCQAHNGLQSETLLFVEESCVTEIAGDRGKKIVTGFSGNVREEVILKFRLFKFKFTNQIAFSITVKLCKGTGNCNATECPNSNFMGLGRKRRGIDDEWNVHTPAQLPPSSDDKFERLSTGLLVYVPGDEIASNAVTGVVKSSGSRYVTTDTALCLQNTWVVLIILLIAFVGIVGGVLVTWICARKLLSNQKVTGPGFTNQAYNTKF